MEIPLRTEVELQWSGEAIASLDSRPESLAREFNWQRLCRLDRLSLAAAFAVDELSGHLLSSHGERTGVVVTAHLNSFDGLRRYLERLGEARYMGIVHDFAQLGGPSTCHFLATALGIRGYATTCLVETDDLRPTDDTVSDVCLLPSIDRVLDLRLMLLSWEPKNTLLRQAFAPEENLVSAKLVSS